MLLLPKWIDRVSVYVVGGDEAYYLRPHREPQGKNSK